MISFLSDLIVLVALLYLLKLALGVTGIPLPAKLKRWWLGE
jgi:hypothetical protein